MGWYIIYTKSRYEKKVWEELVSQKYISYLPLVSKVSTWSDRRKMIEIPLFPSYVFVSLDDIRIYYKLLKIKGVVNFIKFENKFAIVKDSEIEMIKLLIDKSSSIEVNTEIEIGEKKIITSGPFCGYECEVSSYNGKNKVYVSIESLRQVIIAEMDIAYLT
jgi:transcription antitermination factor NusG